MQRPTTATRFTGNWTTGRFTATKSGSASCFPTVSIYGKTSTSCHTLRSDFSTAFSRNPSTRKAEESLRAPTGLESNSGTFTRARFSRQESAGFFLNITESTCGRESPGAAGFLTGNLPSMRSPSRQKSAVPPSTALSSWASNTTGRSDVDFGNGRREV